MTHDPLCEATDTSRWWESCYCDIIAKVREDMVAKCIEAVEAMPLTIHTPIAHRHEECLDPSIHMKWTPVVTVSDILTAMLALTKGKNNEL